MLLYLGIVGGIIEKLGVTGNIVGSMKENEYIYSGGIVGRWKFNYKI